MSINDKWDENIIPAKVKYIGADSKKFTTGQLYDAFFLEYWGDKRDSLHVRGNDGRIDDFNHFEEFEVIEDKQNLLNDYEATVRCVTHRYDKELFDLLYGKEYKAIGRDWKGLYLVKDDSGDCYFYGPDNFEIIDDPHGILKQRSMYYGYHPKSWVPRDRSMS